ncbi:exodeoxyribonuclease VII large subunit [Clostridium sp. AM29-11AC]|uniref:exodeoxyribonuclease VII large subunit n=1 Tax=Clostridium sp. AM29-11AC TaxID=2293028 RepID=UPI000E46BC0B|nr:exodeoxyribonuclease VII large subunit [Clostridium sp. AM29-11AC]MBS5468030.1 exodeoxyribonuclease VII large subunit [Clostridium sp.]RHT56504.1 exodeoxyribonuclease VII large subunit [Clostridium sp. AM29-11AC]
MAGVYSVSQVNAYIKNMFAQDFALSRISIKGEVSNCKYHTSGHIYFTLKDGLAAIQAVMFASRRGGLDFELRDGQQVVVKGSVEVYERDGRYQLYASQIALDGAGDLFRRFEKLRNELEEMGMFAPEYKRPIPKFARTVGVVTASTGAAIRDIINISSRRNPYVQLVLYPARVQGEGAAESIARGIEVLDRMGLDVIIAGRGGGSIEDLWAFNEEIVARAIFRCSTPVISAVGHETDVTIADCVADLRAPTPSAAAELAVFDFGQFEAQLRGAKELLARGLKRKIDGVRYQTEQYRLKLRLHDPQRQINEKRQRLVSAEDELKRLMERRLSDCRHRLALMSGRLHGQSPLEKLSRGFGFITDEEGRRVDHAASVRPGDRLSIRLADGQIEARAEQTELYERLEVQEES